jgi:hypothetical protein
MAYLAKHGTDSNFTSISGDNKAVHEREVCMGKCRRRAEDFFDAVEGILVLGGPYPRDILEGQGPEGLFKISQTTGKSTIVPHHSTELHDAGSPLGRGKRPVVGTRKIGDCMCIGGIGRDASDH